MDIEITASGSGLQGVGRAENGKTVFVPGALPGEKVRAHIVREKDRYIEAGLDEVVSASSCRRMPACKWAGLCGGCAAMHMDYGYSLSLKRDRVLEALKRIGGLDDPCVRQTIGMEASFRTRNKAEYAVSGGRIGLRQENSREIVEIDDCLMQGEKSIEAMRILRAWLKGVPFFNGYLVTRLTEAGEMMCVISFDRPLRDVSKLSERLFHDIDGMKSLYTCRLKPRPSHALDGDVAWMRGEKTLTDTLCGRSFQLHPQSFFQVNRIQAEKLYACAVELAGLAGSETVMDAYCGAGTITLCMAEKAKKVMGVEIVRPAVEDAWGNARMNNMKDRVSFECGDAALVLPRLLNAGMKPDVVVVDPPRKGVDEKLIQALNRAKVSRIVYVSCDPGTLARDIGRLKESYRFELAQPVDMFPWSSHVETVVQLSREHIDDSIK